MIVNAVVVLFVYIRSDRDSVCYKRMVVSNVRPIDTGMFNLILPLLFKLGNNADAKSGRFAVPSKLKRFQFYNHQNLIKYDLSWSVIVESLSFYLRARSGLLGL
jgi:hypothetical protein